MAEAIYVHIGAPKAGSSYLQKMLAAHAETLSEAGFFLPLATRAAQFAAAADLRGETWTDEQEHSWEALAADVASRDGVGIFSEELMCAMTDEQIRRMVADLAPAAVHVVVCARDLARQLPAEWQQSVRGRGTRAYADWLADLRDDPEHWFWERQDPARIAERWMPHLQPGHFHVVTLPPPGAASELLWRRFATAVGLDPELTAPDAPQNESLGVVESELLRRLNAELGERVPLRLPYLRVVRDHVLRPALLGKPGTRRVGIPPDSTSWIADRAAEAAKRLASLDGIAVEGDLQDLSAQSQVVEAGPNEVDDSELLDALLDAWVSQTEKERARHEHRQAYARARADSPQGGELDALRRLAGSYARRTPVRSVAVVGNAPMAPSQARADAIDAADLVIRVNSFVLDTPGQPAVQGRRTDVVLWSRLVKATPFLFERYRERLYVLLEPMRMFGRREVWPASWPADLGFVAARNDEVAVPLNEELGLPWRSERLAPTTGTTAAWLAVKLFPDAEVLLTGLSFVDDPDQAEWDHQWGDSVRVGPEHRIAAEAALLRRWRDEGRVRMLATTAEEMP